MNQIGHVYLLSLDTPGSAVLRATAMYLTYPQFLAQALVRCELAPAEEPEGYWKIYTTEPPYRCPSENGAYWCGIFVPDGIPIAGIVRSLSTALKRPVVFIGSVFFQC